MSWFESRPSIQPGIVTTNTDQIRLTGGIDLSKIFRLDTSIAYNADRTCSRRDGCS